MTESGFECVREDSQKLWVKTPFPITHNVWGFFVKDIFPRFSMSEPCFSSEKPKNSLLRNSSERWNDSRFKYLVRGENPDGGYKSCITDGEGFRWTHADLPDDKRTGLQVHDWGLIYIPNQAQVGYLDTISTDLAQKSGERVDLLSQINQTERVTTEGLLLKLKEVLNQRPENIGELRKKAIGVYGDYSWIVADYRTRELPTIGELPLTSKSPVNTIEGQTELDFYRILDRLFFRFR